MTLASPLQLSSPVCVIFYSIACPCTWFPISGLQCETCRTIPRGKLTGSACKLLLKTSPTTSMQSYLTGQKGRAMRSLPLYSNWPSVTCGVMYWVYPPTTLRNAHHSYPLVRHSHPSFVCANVASSRWRLDSCHASQRCRARQRHCPCRSRHSAPPDYRAHRQTRQQHSRSKSFHRFRDDGGRPALEALTNPTDAFSCCACWRLVRPADHRRLHDQEHCP